MQSVLPSGGQRGKHMGRDVPMTEASVIER